METQGETNKKKEERKKEKKKKETKRSNKRPGQAYFISLFQKPARRQLLVLHSSQTKNFYSQFA
jgi:hypothetical protein